MDTWTPPSFISQTASPLDQLPHRPQLVSRGGSCTANLLPPGSQAETGVPWVRFHNLRRSCAAIMLYLGCSLKDIQTWLGHSNYNFTADTYVHSGIGVHEQMANSLSEKLGMVLPENLLPGSCVEKMLERC